MQASHATDNTIADHLVFDTALGFVGIAWREKGLTPLCLFQRPWRPCRQARPGRTACPPRSGVRRPRPLTNLSSAALVTSMNSEEPRRGMTILRSSPSRTTK